MPQPAQMPKDRLFCCRACLTTDCRLYDIHENKVNDAFALITDTPASRDQLPQHLCAWCLTLLRKCMLFRAMALRTHQRLTEIILWKMGSIDTYKPPRSIGLTRSEFVMIDCVPSKNNIKNEPPGLMGDAIKADPEIELEAERSNKVKNTFDPKNEIIINKTHAKNMVENRISKSHGNFNTENYHSDFDQYKVEHYKIDDDDDVVLAVKSYDDVHDDNGDKVVNVNNDDDIVNCDNDSQDYDDSNNVINDDGIFKDYDGSDNIVNVINSDDIVIDDDVNNDSDDVVNVNNDDAIVNDDDASVDNDDGDNVVNDKNDDDIVDADGARDDDGIINDDIPSDIDFNNVVKIYDNIVDVNDDQDDGNPLKNEKVKADKPKEVLIEADVETDLKKQFCNNEDKMEIDDEEVDIRVDNYAKTETKIGSKLMKMIKNHMNSSQTATPGAKRFILIKLINDRNDISSPVEDPLKKEEFDKPSRKAAPKRKKYNNTNHLKDSVKQKGKGGRRKKKRIKDLRHPTDGYILFDFDAFESANEVKITVLTKEEQLEEIASRKKSRNYVKSPYKCEECGKGYLQEAAYTNHRTKQHNVSLDHVCDVCGMRFKRNYRRQNHQDSHRLKFSCQLCSFVCRRRQQARAHRAMHAGKTFECQHCGKSFKKKSSYLSHARLSHPGHNVACAECGETFVGDRGLRSHMTLSHPETLIKFKCSICSANFNSVEALNRHTEQGEHSGLRPCEQCGDNCASEEELQEHVKEKHPTESYHCEECATAFSGAAAYDTHVARKHRDPHVRTRRLYEFAGASHVCDRCGYVAKSSTLLVYHMRSHLAVKPFACTLCPKTFQGQSYLNHHMLRHSGEKPFHCAHCSLQFHLKGNLVRHMKVVHLGLRASFPCVDCGRVFTTKGSLKLHQRTVHGGAPWPRRKRGKVERHARGRRAKKARLRSGSEDSEPQSDSE